MKRIERIFLDVDGVLVDFVGGALKLFEAEALLETWPAGEYDICKVLSVEPAEFWAKITLQGPTWWLRLPSYPWAEKLYRLAAAVASVSLLTTAPRDPGSFTGKALWCQNFLARINGGEPSAQRGFTITAEPKANFARPDILLIDDSDQQVRDFVVDAGRVLAFPQPWNRFHRHAVGPGREAHVFEQLRSLAK